MKAATGWVGLVLAVLCGGGVGVGVAREEPAVSLPPGVVAAWDLQTAHREGTATRERASVNGLWRWQPAGEEAEPPLAGWGYFKVPGSWPGITDYMQKDCQQVFAHPNWQRTRLGSLSAAWYEREVSVPAEWQGQRVLLRLDALNSLASVWVDGRKVGELRFPGGELDLSQAVRAGETHRVSLRVEALPLRAVMASFSDSARQKEVRGQVARRGLCGDAWLVSEPPGARVEEVRVDPSVRLRRLGIEARVAGLEEGASYVVRAKVLQGQKVVAELASPVFRGDEVKGGMVRVEQAWMPEALWDLNSPENQLVAQVTLATGEGEALDTEFDERFGFRELWIEGRDFYLNGSRVHLSAIPLDNAQVGAYWASYEGARESLLRLKSTGINFVYTHNYGCEPGTHLGFEEVLRAADDVGMLVAFSQPHFGQYDWKAPEADRINGYREHAAYYAGVAGNHPSVVFYSMSHNATGYSEDMNPDLLAGEQDPRDEWAKRNAALARRAEAIVRDLDPGRVVYHHSSGNLGSMHTSNFYPNFVPIQELSDWFEKWSKEGVKPMFTCEYGAPFTWDWAMYRGWYKGEREFGSAAVPWEFCHAEWNAQFDGDAAYRLTEMEQANIRWEARQFREGKTWYRWDYPYELSSRAFSERQEVIGRYLTENWRAYRTWGLSAISPWEYGHFWELKEGVEKGRRELAVDWGHLQRPGFSADFLEDRYERMDLAHDREDWKPAAAGRALLRNNGPLLAYLGGGPTRFTSQAHNFAPGEVVAKQAIVLNNSRQPVGCDCDWTFSKAGVGEPALSGRANVTVPTGDQARVGIEVPLGAEQAPGAYELRLVARFSTGEVQEDVLVVDVLPVPGLKGMPARVALFDPVGETRAALEGLGVPVRLVEATDRLTSEDILVIGKKALTPTGPAPDLSAVREGMRVVVFEQTAEALERRLGFRVVEYGLRDVHVRVPGHPALRGISSQHLHDWRGDATNTPQRLSYEMRPMYGPTVTWCDIPVTRAWRCGNQGNVASVLIEKPARGDFLPVVDGGYAQQYSALAEYREGRGVVVFCQLDVTGRTEREPAAQVIERSLLEYVGQWKPPERRQVVYAGEEAGLRYLEGAGVRVVAFGSEQLGEDRLLVVGPGGAEAIGPRGPEVAQWLKRGGKALAIGLGEVDAAGWLPASVEFKEGEHVGSYFEASADAWLAGLGPADVQNRDPRRIPLVSGGASVVGDGVLGKAQGAEVVFCQLPVWRFDPGSTMNVKRTFRRVAFLTARLLGNLGVEGATPLLARFGTPAGENGQEPRWKEGLYLDQPEEWDDPYRFFRW